MKPNDTPLHQNSDRCSDTLFNQIACFGKGYSPDGQETLIPTSFSESDIYKIFAQQHMNSEQLIKLFIQSVLLNAFLSQDFPLIFVEDPMWSLLNSQIAFVAESKDIQPSTAIKIMTTLSTSVENAVQKLIVKAEQSIDTLQNPLADAQRDDFKAACQGFLTRMLEYFQMARQVFITLKDDMILTNEFINICLKPLYTEYEYGRLWAMDLLEYGFLNFAQVNIEPDTSGNKHSIKMQTLSDYRRRYIEFTIASHLSIADFINIPIYIFHEYLSHLIASTYTGSIQSEQPMDQVIKSYERIPSQLDEGWMIHVAQKFLLSKIDTLLGLDRQHLQYMEEKAIDYWVTNMHYIGAGKPYFSLGVSGIRIATNFLRFLRQDVCQGNEKRAYELYYRISIDLIMHYPNGGFEHLDFMIAIEKLCKSNKIQSIQIVQNSLDEEGKYINIERLWQLMKDLPGPGLGASLGL